MTFAVTELPAYRAVPMPAALAGRPAAADPAPRPEPLRLPQPGAADRRLLDHLRQSEALPAALLAGLRATHLRDGTPVEDGLRAIDALDEDTLQGAMAQALGCARLPGPLLADPALLDRLGADACLAGAFVPLGRRGSSVLLATASPANLLRQRRRVERVLGRFRFVLAPRAEIEAAVLACCNRDLLDRAERSVPARESCRGWSENRLLALGLGCAATLAAALLLAPGAVLLGLTLLALASLAAMTALRIAAALATLTRLRPQRLDFRHRRPPPYRPLPMVSVLVPLHREREIAGRLIRRLAQLDYPRERLEICLVIEADDALTRTALADVRLPPWMRVVEVPRGAVKTKPRALNYALHLCRGSIVGIYDAEDAPEPDQIRRIVARFAEAPPEVICLQGVLDFYNPTETWLTRCFTLEYAAWFRLILPGLARLGLVVPLGGTTLFFRRAALERLGSWDAFNVTEDADLGLRIARHGYRTELIATVTREEATSHAWPWVRQRSRWLKGYAMTAACHLMHPRSLLRDLGPWRFLGVVVLLPGTVLQYLLAPLLWSFWIVAFGLPHPVSALLGPGGRTAMLVLFAAAEVANLATLVVAARSTRHRGLAWYAPLTTFYFPLGSLAAWKGVIEIASRPYFWDKTSHGHTPADAAQANTASAWSPSDLGAAAPGARPPA